MITGIIQKLFESNTIASKIRVGYKARYARDRVLVETVRTNYTVDVNDKLSTIQL